VRRITPIDGIVMADLQLYFREFMHLDRKRTGEGLTPLEYQRWRALARELSTRFSKGPPRGGAERRESVRVSTRLKVSFESPAAVSQALMTNLSRGGLFINTAFPAEPGPRLELKLLIESTGKTLQVPVEVVSSNVGEGFRTGQLGMGVRFLPMPTALRKQLDDFYEALASRSLEDSEGAETAQKGERAASVASRP
jgi:uncharacterized protein (TIGR02266 family)